MKSILTAIVMIAMTCTAVFAIPPENNTCDGAFTIGRCTEGNTFCDIRYATNNYNLDPSYGCTGYSSPGLDITYVMELGAGDVINMIYTSYEADGSFYIVTDCDDLSTCVAGADATLTGEPEEIVDFSIPFTGTYYLILDNYVTDTGGHSELTWDISLPPPPVPAYHISPTLSQEGDRTGRSVATDRGLAVIGTPGRGDQNQGSVVIFERNGAIWDEVAELTTEMAEDGSSFGHSVAIDGDYVIVGNPNDGEGTMICGAAYVFHYQNGSWSTPDKLLNLWGVNGDKFGWSVDICRVSGNSMYAVVGAPGDDEDHIDGGSFFVYHNDGTGWDDGVRLVPDDAAPWDELGSSIAVNFNNQDDIYIIVGSPKDDCYYNDNYVDQSGSAYVFYLDEGGSTGWEQQRKLEAADPYAGGHFGWSVDLEDELAVVGSPGDNHRAGAVYVYSRDLDGPNTWSQQTKIMADQPWGNAELGESVSLDLPYLLAGAGYELFNGTAYVFYNFAEGGWEEKYKLWSTNGENGDDFGQSVSMDYPYALVGAPENSEHGLYAGMAYAYYVGSIEGEWLPMGSGIQGSVYALLEYFDGSTNYLIAGGDFTTAGGQACNNIAKWDGNSWSPMGDGMNNVVHDLSLDVDGSQLIAGGNFTQAGGVNCNYVARWDGDSWNAMGDGMNDTVFALHVNEYDCLGLVAGGNFTQAGGQDCYRVAAFYNGNWVPVGPISYPGVNGSVAALTSYHGHLHAGGTFTQAGNNDADYIARYAASWTCPGGGMESAVMALTTYPVQSATGYDLIAGGVFLRAGGVQTPMIAMWDEGIGTWQTLGGGMSEGATDGVHALAMHGGELIAGGFFSAAGGIPTDNIAAWNGSGWNAIGGGLDGWVRSLATYEGRLIAGGHFEGSGGAYMPHIACWNAGVDPTAPPGDDCGGKSATYISEVANLPFNTTNATYDGEGSCIQSPNIWFCYTPSTTGTATISLCGSAYDTKLAVYDECFCGMEGTLVCCNDDFCGRQSQCVIDVVEGNSYQIEIGGSSSYDTGYGFLTITCEPVELLDWADHDAGNWILTMTDQGNLGFMDEMQNEGSGLIYPADGSNHLYVGSLWVGADSTYVANRDFNTDPNREWVMCEDPDGHVEVEEGGEAADQVIHAVFTDDGAGSTLGLRVHQESWAFENELEDDFIIIRYFIHNVGELTQEGLYAGMFLDIDLGNQVDDEGYTDASRQMAYMTDTSGVYVGLRLLDGDQMPDRRANLTLIHNPTYVWPESYILDRDKIEFLKGEDRTLILRDGSTPDDYSMLLSAGPFTLAPGDSNEVVFAVIGGMSLADLQANAEEAQITYLGDASDIALDPDPAVLITRLLPNAPNPFNQTTVMRFQLAVSSDVKLVVYDVNGRQVRILAEGFHNSGAYSLTWDGRDGAGHRAASGVYFSRFQAGSHNECRRLLLLR